MASITQNTGIHGFSLPLLDALDLHCFWARFFDQVQYGYRGHHFSDDTLCYFRSGQGWIRRDGGEKQAWQAPCLFLFRKTVAYSAQATGPIQADSMHFRAELSGKPPVSLMDLLDVPPVLPADLTAPIAPILMQMSEEFLGKRLGSQWMLDGQLRILLAHFLRGWWPAQPADRTAAASRGLLRLAPALTWMTEHLAEPISVDAMAAQVGLSAGHFSAFFKQTFGTTPAQYLIQLRVDRARRMLITTDLTVNQIAHALGFTYPHYFIRQFKQSTQQTPAAYRAANTK